MKTNSGTGIITVRKNLVEDSGFPLIEGELEVWFDGEELVLYVANK